jgi:predicted DNA-binding transcriptional regulator YafY
MKSALVRSIELLRRLPRAPRRVDAATLETHLRSLGFTTTRRMIQRDLVALAVHFPIDSQEHTRPYGWAWAAHATPPVVPTMDVSTALLFRLAELHLTALLPPNVRRVLAPQFEAAAGVLARAGGETTGGALTDRVRIISPGFTGAAPAVDEAVLTAVTEAVAVRRVLVADYAARGRSTPKTYRLHPLGLVSRGGVLVLIAAVEAPGGAPPGDARSFVLHRFVRAEVTPGAPSRGGPDGFRLDDHIAAGGLAVRLGVEPIDLVLRVFEPAAVTIREGVFGAQQSIEETTDGVVLRVRLNDTQALRAWILGFGMLAEVVEPESV